MLFTGFNSSKKNNSIFRSNKVICLNKLFNTFKKSGKNKHSILFIESLFLKIKKLDLEKNINNLVLDLKILDVISFINLKFINSFKLKTNFNLTYNFFFIVFFLFLKYFYKLLLKNNINLLKYRKFFGIFKIKNKRININILKNYFYIFKKLLLRSNNFKKFEFNYFNKVVNYKVNFFFFYFLIKKYDLIKKLLFILNKNNNLKVFSSKFFNILKNLIFKRDFIKNFSIYLYFDMIKYNKYNIVFLEFIINYFLNNLKNNNYKNVDLCNNIYNNYILNDLNLPINFFYFFFEKTKPNLFYKFLKQGRRRYVKVPFVIIDYKQYSIVFS